LELVSQWIFLNTCFISVLIHRGLNLFLIGYNLQIVKYNKVSGFGSSYIVYTVYFLFEPFIFYALTHKSASETFDYFILANFHFAKRQVLSIY